MHSAGKILKGHKGEAWMIGRLLQTKALSMINFRNVPLDKNITTSASFNALLIMPIGSTMLTGPVVAPKLARYSGKLNGAQSWQPTKTLRRTSTRNTPSSEAAPSTH